MDPSWVGYLPDTGWTPLPLSVQPNPSMSADDAPAYQRLSWRYTIRDDSLARRRYFSLSYTRRGILNPPPSHVTLYPTPFSRTSLTFAEPPSSSLAPNVSERTLYYSRKKDRLENFLDIRLFVWLIQASEISLGLLQSVLRRFTKYRYNLIMQNV